MDVISVPTACAQQKATAAEVIGGFSLYRKGSQGRAECMLDEANLHRGEAPWRSMEEKQLSDDFDKATERPFFMHKIVSLAKAYHSKYTLGSKHLLEDKSNMVGSLERMYPGRKAPKAKAVLGVCDRAGEQRPVRRKSRLSLMTCRGDSDEVEDSAMCNTLKVSEP